MPTIVHFEIPADDVQRSRKFYTDLFGWKIEKWPSTDDSQLTSAATGQPIEYWMVTTTDDKGNKALGGGIMKRQMSEHYVTNYIGVKSVDEYSSKVEKLAGKVDAPKHAIAGIGYFAHCVDFISWYTYQPVSYYFGLNLLAYHASHYHWYRGYSDITF
jgi:predicted enzyme related to lactoylglutathione lyase